jgi:integrase
VAVKTHYPRTIRNGSATAKIYKVATHSGTVYSVDYILDGKRTRRAFTDPEEAHGHAKAVVGDMAKGRVHDAKITGRDADQLTEAKRMLAGTGTPLTVVVGEWVALKKKAGDIPLGAIVDYYLMHRPDKVNRTLVKDAVAKYLKDLDQDGAAPKYLKEQSRMLNRFAGDFNLTLDMVTSAAVDEWVRNLRGVNHRHAKKQQKAAPLAPRSRKNYLVALSALFNWARGQQMVPKTFTEIQDVRHPKATASDPHPLTVDEMVNLLSAADDEFKPYLLLRGFAGIRADEITRMDWSMIGADYIRLPASVTKTKTGRIIPIQPNLAAWLAGCRQKKGKVCPYRNPSNKLTETTHKAGFAPRHNALRDAFVSYRVAVTQDAAKVALEAGNSPRVIAQSYLQLKTAEEGKAWFSIMPENVNKVVVLNQKEAA